MALISWEDRLSVQVKEFDLHHKQIIAMINELHDSMKQGKRQDVIPSILSNLASYVGIHFKAEEEVMERHNYLGYIEHKAKHEKMTAKVLGFVERYKKGDVSVVVHLSSFLKDWLNKHILETDKKYAGFMHDVGVN